MVVVGLASLGGEGVNNKKVILGMIKVRTVTAPRPSFGQTRKLSFIETVVSALPGGRLYLLPFAIDPIMTSEAVNLFSGSQALGKEAFLLRKCQ